MTKYIVYNTTTGAIRAFGVCPTEYVEHQVKEGDSVYIGECPKGATHIINNEPVTIVPEPTPTSTEQILYILTTAVQNHLDDTAKTKNYDGILSLCSYAMSTKNKFKNEGQAGVSWRDDCWDYCYQVLADVEAGQRTIPTPEELVAELPTIAW